MEETEYPYRLAHFQESSVKFVDEGMVEEPTFKKFIISNTCPFEVNNLKNASSADIFLVMEGARTCEIIKISQNSIILSGFNITTNSNYNIVYKKLN